MDKKVILLGCAVEYLPVIFDLCFDTNGSTEFHIYKNIAVNSKPEMPVETAPHYSLKYYEPSEPFEQKGGQMFLGVTGPYGKRKVFEYFHKKWGVSREEIGILAHPASTVAPSAMLDNASLFEPGVIISSQTKLGFAVTVKRKVSIGHHCILNEFVEINPGVTLSGHVHVGRSTIIGSGAVIRNGISIGERSVIGMGSVVTKNIPDGVVAYGNPCKVIRNNPKRE